MQKSLLIGGAALLAACGVGVTASNNIAESATQRSARQPVAPRARPSGLDPWIGVYGGDLAGEMRVTRGDGLNRYRVKIETADAGCGGSIEGMAAATPNRMTLTVPAQPEIEQCQIVLDRRGGSIHATEIGGCFNYYGGQCQFRGRYERVPSSAVPASSAVAAPPARRTWIVGAWIARGSPCGEGVTYSPDGTYVTDIQTGRWRLEGNTLIETALTNDEEGGTIRNPQPERSQITSVAANRNAFTVRYPDGGVYNMVRCR